MIRGVILDLDGTVYLGTEQVPGAVRFLEFLKREGIRFLFVTNRANRTPEQIRDQLSSYGIPCRAEDVLTSAQAAVQYLKPGRAWYIGEEGLSRELKNAGFAITDRSPEYVIVSFDHDPTPAKIRKAADLIVAGAQFVATNPDKNLPLEGRILPGTGAIVDAVVKECGIKPLMIGKPERLILDMALKKMAVSSSDAINVGDNVETDIPAGVNAGIRTAFILTGISTLEDLKRCSARPTWIIKDYVELEEIVLKENAGERK